MGELATNSNACEMGYNKCCQSSASRMVEVCELQCGETEDSPICSARLKVGAGLELQWSLAFPHKIMNVNLMRFWPKTML